MFLKARDQKLRTFSMTGVISIALSAIIEPTLFGMLVQNKKLWLAQIIGGAAGGAFCGLMGVVTTAFTFGSVTTFPAFVSSDAMNFAWAMVGHAHCLCGLRGAGLCLLRQGAEARLRA